MKRTRRYMAVSVVVAASTLAGCSGGGSGSAALSPPPTSATTTTTSTVLPTTTSVVAATTTTPIRRATTTTVAATPRFSRPGDAALALVEAWKAGDRRAASAAATAEAVEALFRHDWTAAEQPSECVDRETGVFDCFVNGPAWGRSLRVTGGASAGYRVVAVTLRPLFRNEIPQVAATPGRAPVGSRVRIEGFGFTPDQWPAEGSLWLVGRSPGCPFYAQAEHRVSIGPDGHLVGEFVVPSTGNCRMSDQGGAVLPGDYEIAYACTPCFIGTFSVP